MTLKNVLFLCRDNAAVSIMAEAYMTVAGRGVARAFSAGSDPAREIHPLALETLKAAGVRHSGLAPKSWNAFALPQAPKMDLVVYLCDPDIMPGAPEWRGRPERLVLGLSWSHLNHAAGLRAADFLGQFAELRTLTDSLLLEMPGISAREYPRVA